MDVQQYNATMAAVDEDNPSGAWADAPDLAASTVAMTNDSGYHVIVGISGGTVTVIKINGITITGVTSGRFTLKRNDTVAITYSGAPTLQWLYA